MRLPLALAALLLAAPLAAADKPELVIYTYDSFTSEWGPGPDDRQELRGHLRLHLRFVGAGDGAALLGRLQLEGERSPADIVLGLDTNLTAEAKATGLFAPHGIDRRRSTCRSPGTTTPSCPSTGAGSPSSTTGPRCPTRRRASRT